MKKLTGHLLLIGGGVDTADFRYATGFDPVDPVVCIRYRGKSTLIVPAMEKGRALREVKRDVDVLTPDQLLPLKKQKRLSDWIVAYARQQRIRRFFVTGRCPVGIVRQLWRHGLSVAVLSAPPFPEREVKKRDEVEKIARVQNAAVAAFNAVVAVLKKARVAKNGALLHRGKALTSNDLQTLIALELFKRNCAAQGTIVACGAQSADPHERGHGPLRSNTPIVVDIFPRDLRTGYWGDLTRTVVRGRASERVRQMHAAVLAAHHAVMRAARPGIKLARLHALAAKTLEAHGFKTNLEGTPEGFIHSTGHGVGLEIHEPPSIGPVKGVLRKGHVVTIEPGLYYRREGGMRLEDTVYIDSDGARVLARVGYDLEI